MDKLISKDNILNILINWDKESIWPLTISDAIFAIKNAPVIEDVTQVVHSKWVLSAIDEYIDENGDTIYGFHYYCENCGVEIYETDENISSNYCFNCGAKMDGGTKGDC